MPKTAIKHDKSFSKNDSFFSLTILFTFYSVLDLIYNVCISTSKHTDYRYKVTHYDLSKWSIEEGISYNSQDLKSTALWKN